MPQPKVPAIPPAERINASYKALATASVDLNSAANELNKTISGLSETLESLNLGVSAWHTISEDTDHDNGNYWSRSIGYTMTGQQWCIAFREASGNEFHDDHTERVYAFHEAPRWMVIESLGKLPELFETLLERVRDVTQKLKARTEQTKELLVAVRAAAAEISPPKDTK
jgi:hypothetical protein